MRRKVLTAIVALVLSTVLQTVVVGVAEAEPPSSCQDYVHIFHRTGQPVTAWVVRITGTDLLRLVNDTAGKAFITIDDDDGTESIERPFDEGHPLSISVVLNGRDPRMIVSITNLRNTYTGCSQTYNLPYS